MMWQAINTMGLVALGLLGIWQTRVTKEIKISIDGRLTQLLELTKTSAHAEGVQEQKAKE